MKILSILGPNAAGKTTICKLVEKEKTNIKYICAGDLLRKEIDEGTAFGLEYKEKMAKGEFAPVEVMNSLLWKELDYLYPDAYCDEIEDEKKIIILDGFPRNKEQLEFAKEKFNISKCIYFDISDASVILNRSLNRGRPDDTEEVIKQRLKTFYEVTTPVIDYYKSIGKFVSIDATKQINEVKEQFEHVLTYKLPQTIDVFEG
jgi:adenylate kinase